MVCRKQMKYAKAWPDTKANSNPEDAQVFPKALVQQTVENTVENLLKDAFGSAHDEEDPQLSESETKHVKKAKTKPVERAPSHERSVDATQTLWIAFGILAFFTFLFLMSLYQRISAMEAWLHGRLTTHT
jgi:hypothetical protein